MNASPSSLTSFSPKRGRSVTSLGVLFDFTGNDVNTTVQKVEDMVNEQWVRVFVPRSRGLFYVLPRLRS